MLEIQQIHKQYKQTKALVDVSLTLKAGVYALLGPNGAGKSTLMNVLTQQLKMDRGTILWNGVPIQKMKQAYFDIIGYAPQQQGLYEEFSGGRFLTYMALLKRIPKKEIQSEVLRVASLVHMEDQLQKKCKT